MIPEAEDWNKNWSCFFVVRVGEERKTTRGRIRKKERKKSQGTRARERGAPKGQGRSRGLFFADGI